MHCESEKHWIFLCNQATNHLHCPTKRLRTESCSILSGLPSNSTSTDIFVNTPQQPQQPKNMDFFSSKKTRISRSIQTTTVTYYLSLSTWYASNIKSIHFKEIWNKKYKKISQRSWSRFQSFTLQCFSAIRSIRPNLVLQI